MTRNTNLPPGCTWKDIDPPDTCPECEGFGKIEDPENEDEMIKCDLCDSTGRIEEA